MTKTCRMNSPNTPIHNLISVLHITQFLLEDAMVSSKTRVVEARSTRETIVAVKNDKTISMILPFIRVLYRKLQNNILRGYYSLKFENSLFSNKLSNCKFRSRRVVYATKKDHIKYFIQNWLTKRASSMCKLLLDSAVTAINYDSLSLSSTLFRELQVLEMY